MQILGSPTEEAPLAQQALDVSITLGPCESYNFLTFLRVVRFMGFLILVCFLYSTRLPPLPALPGGTASM